MEKLCQAQNGCDRHLVRYFLFEFWNQCTDELEARHPEILQLYEYLYIFNPFRDAVCSKDASGKYCLPTITKNAAKKSPKTKRAMPLPQDVYSEAYWARVLPTIPRSHMMAATNASSSPAINTSQLPSLAPQQVFFFLSGESDPDVLCTECSKHVLAAYISYELSSPYAPGLENSGVLKSQQSIYRPGLGRRITSRPHAPSVGLVGSSVSFVYIATTSVEMGAWHDGSQATTSYVSLRWAAAPARIVAHGPPNPSGPSLVSGRQAARVVAAAVAPACTAGWPGC